MEGYLGEFDPPEDHPYLKYTPKDFALLWIVKYGSIDGEHHKLWVIDQVARILCGNKVIIKVAKWGEDYEETRVWLEEEPTAEYTELVREARDGEDGPNTYDWDVGIPP